MTQHDEAQFGTADCTCIPFTRQENPPRYLNRPTDTVNMISGWERRSDCPHHAPAGPPPAGWAAILTDAERTMLRYALDQAQERIWSEDGFTNADQAAIDSLRRMADEAQPASTVARDAREALYTAATGTGRMPEADAVRHLNTLLGAGAHEAQPAQPQTDMTERLERGREQLIEAMSGVSEERWYAGWMHDLDRRLHAEGGIWEILGRAVGWPTGDYNDWVWVSWDEAAALYAQPKAGGGE